MDELTGLGGGGGGGGGMGGGMGGGDPSEMPQELQDMARQMEAFREADPAAFEALMASSMAARESGGDVDAALGKLQEAMAAHQAAAVAESGLEMPGGRKMGLDGKVTDPNVASIEITPTGAFVIKTKREDAREGSPAKVFINVATHEALGEPHLKKKLDEESGEEVEGWNIPLSVGPPRSCSDQKGDKAVVYDCIVNPQVVTNAEKDETGNEKDFLVQLCLQYVESKYKCQLDRRYKLPKLKYKTALGKDGLDSKKVETQRVRDTSKTPSISEVSSSNSGSGSSSSGSGGKAKGGKRGKMAPKGAKKVHDIVERKLSCSVAVQLADGTEETEADWRERNAYYGDDVGDASNEKENLPVVRPNGVDDSSELPRFMVVTAGPLSHHSIVADPAALAVDVTEYAVSLKLPGHLPASATLPFAAVPAEAEAIVRPHDECYDEKGQPGLGTLTVRVPVDPTPNTAGVDPGSRPWMLMQALEGGGDGRKEGADAEEGGEAESEGRAGPSAEDRFHLRAKPKGGYDPHTGLQSREEEPVAEDEELPEDRFHREDALSNHYIQQREGDRKEKWRKHEEEKKDREANPEKDEGVEYIDVDDFKPGGKYGPAAIDLAAKRDELSGINYTETEEMRKARNIVLSGGAGGGAATGIEGDTTGPSAAAASKEGAASGVSGELKSSLWADLLD